MTSKPKLYLSGRIANCTHEQIHGWREEVKTLWGREFCIDPSRRVFFDRRDARRLAKEIVELDKLDIVRSDVLFVYYEQPSAGTIMEIIYAFMIGKMVIIACADIEVLETLSPWIIYHSHFQTAAIDRALDYISDYYGDVPVNNRQDLIWS